MIYFNKQNNEINMLTCFMSFNLKLMTRKEKYQIDHRFSTGVGQAPLVVNRKLDRPQKAYK